MRRGTYPIAAGLAKLPAAVRSQVSQQLQALGLQTENCQVWLDNSQQVRKVITTAGAARNRSQCAYGQSFGHMLPVSLPIGAGSPVRRG